MRRIKIAFIIDHLNIGGTETQLYLLLKGMNKELFDPVVFVFKEKGETAGKIEALGIGVHLIGVPMAWLPQRAVSDRFLQAMELARMFRERKIDIVQSYLLTANIFGTLAARTAGTPVVCISERGLLPGDGPETFDRRCQTLRNIFAAVGDAAIGNSQAVVDYLEKGIGIPAGKLHCIYNGIETRAPGFEPHEIHDLHKELNLSPGIKLVGMIARLVPIKNPVLFLEAVRLLKDRDDFRAVFIGGGQMEPQLRRYTREFDMEAKVYLLGNRTDVPRLLPSLEIVVQSSSHEGFPNSIMEAMVAKKPVVVTDAGGTVELVIEGETGFIFPRGDKETFAGKIAFLLDNPGIAREMGEKGRAHIRENFSVEKMITAAQELYRHLYYSKPKVD